MPSSSPSASPSTASLPLDDVSPKEKLTPEQTEKAARISAVCQDGDLCALIELATTKHGLVNDELRRTAWPLLLGYRQDDDSVKKQPSWRSLPPHKDENQVALDVARAFVYYPHEPEKQLERRKEELSDLILEVLRRYPSLNYFQGYHDIVQVFLLVLGAQEATPAVARMSLLRIRDFMLPALDPAISHLELLPPVIEATDPVLYNHIPKMQPYFALGATITMFAHVIQEYGDIARLFDLFLAKDAVIPIYFFAAVLLSRREELLDIDKEDTDILHATLGKLPQPLDLEFLIAHGVELYERHPPEKLRSWAWWRVSSSSVLKASRTPIELSNLTLDDGVALLRKQEIEVRRKQALDRAVKGVRLVKIQMWRYRRSGAYGLAILVGVYALWFGRNSGMTSRVTNFGHMGDLLKRAFAILR